MKKTAPYEHAIILKKNSQLNNVYDIELCNNIILKEYSSLECHVVLYPYSRKITSDNIVFCPFEEYVTDIQSNQRSAYQKIVSQFNKGFGILLGLLIFAGFSFFQPQSIISAESLLSILGAYFIGKELWIDLENLFIKISQCWRIRYQPSYYSYQLVRNSTLAFYSRIAKKNRYGKMMLLPEKIDFIAQSNSQTVRLFYEKESYKDKKDKTLHVMSIHLDPDIIDEFSSQGYMLGVKLSFNKKFFGITIKKDFFQSLDHHNPGCLNHQGVWCDNAIFSRSIVTIGGITFFVTDFVIKNACIIIPKNI